MVTLGLITERPAGPIFRQFFSSLQAVDLAKLGIVVSKVCATFEQAIEHGGDTGTDVWVLPDPTTLRAESLHRLCGDSIPKLLPQPIVVVCADEADMVSALEHRVSAIVLADDSPWQAASAIHAAAARALFVSPRLLSRYRHQLVELITSPPSSRIDALTRREHDVLICLAEGGSNSEIAHRLFISRATVGSHVLAILRKLDASNRTEAAAFAYRYGLMSSRGNTQPGSPDRTRPASPAVPINGKYMRA
ncbi:response regulator transcription factor [Amycolatopsis palatopharyngis]|uniref:response regulator transcription factor n=1 Tax=Amycolatopsis palatopharyngis TaxID=187982 RepID=UPI000E2741B9|nr:response regulator transcription factor [Amycolatopsis palatopharyngis]